MKSVEQWKRNLKGVYGSCYHELLGFKCIYVVINLRIRVST